MTSALDASPCDSPTDAEWFERLFNEHHRNVWRFVARMAGADAADDIAGEVFTIAYAGRASYDPARGAPRAWLYGIAANRLRTKFRSDGRARRAFARAAWQRDVGGDVIQLVDDGIELSATLRCVLDAMARLAADERTLLVLAAWEELPYGEIAEVLGVPVGTVKSRLARVRERLREFVARTEKTLPVVPIHPQETTP